MPTSTGSDLRQILLKFRGDLSSLKENSKDIERTVNSLGSMLKKERAKSAAEAKTVHDANLKNIREQAEAQAANARAKQAQSNSELAAIRAQAEGEKQKILLQQQQIKLQQQQLALRRQQAAAEHGGSERGGGEGGIAKLLTSFTGAATGGGLLNSLVAGAAGGGMFFIFEKLSEAAGEVVKTFAEIPTRAGEIVEKLEQMSARAGVSTQQLQELRLAGAAVNLPMERMSRALMMMNLQFTRTQGGISKAEKELARFGVSIRDAEGNTLPVTEIIKHVSDLFQQLPDGMTKSRLAADLFTRRIGSQMIPLLNQGSEAIQGLYDRANKYSILVSEDVLEAQRKWKVENEALKMQWEQFEVMMGSGLLPLLGKILEYVNGIAEGWNKILGGDIPKQFSDDVSNWGTRQGALNAGPGGKYGRMQISEKGKSHFKEQVPQDVMKEKGIIFQQTWEEWYKTVRDAGGNLEVVISAFGHEFPDAIEKADGASNKLDKRLQDNSKNIAKLHQAALKYLEVLSQFKEKNEEAATEQSRFDLKNKYDQGLISQEDFNQRSANLNKQDYDSKVKYINDWAKLEKEKTNSAAEMQRTALVGEVEDAAEQSEKLELLASETAEKIKIIEVQKQEKLLDAQRKFHRSIDQITLEEAQSQQKTRQVNYQTELKLNQDRIDQEKSFLESRLHLGVMSAEEYLRKRIDLINQEIQVSREAAEEEYKNGKKTPEALAQEWAKFREAQAKGEKEYNALIATSPQLKMNASQTRYQNFLGLAQGQLAISQMMPGASGVNSSRDAMQQIITLTKNYRDEQAALLRTVIPLSDEWFKIQGNIQKATEEMIKMNLELLKSKSSMVGIGGIFQQLSTLLGQMGVSRGGFANIGTAGGILESLGTARAKRKASGKNESGGVFADMADAFKGFNFGKLGESMNKFSEGMKGAIGAVGNFAQMLGGSHGHAGDIAGGAIGGFGLGGDIGGMFSKFSSMAGPIGSIAGAAFGGILSGIIGKKNNETQKFIEQVDRQMQALTAAISNGTLGIQSGIQQLQSLRQSVLTQAHSSKKKQRGQLEQEAQAIQNQIIQLQEQQEAMFIDLGNQLKVLNSPTAFQGLLGNLKDIMDQYKKFAGAARDAKDLAMANEFLADSLRNFSDAQATSLNQAEQTAIQDAIKLNDLIRDRIQLLTEEAQSEYDIMTQGVLVNQRTVAMTKMQQIQQARHQLNIQLENMNQEIALTTYKVDGEKQIFTLASTRIELEAQLLLLQEAQTDKDILRIKALQQVVQMLNSGTPLTNMDQVIAALFGSVAPSSIPGGQNNPGNSDLEGLLNDLRNRRSREGFSGSNGYWN